MKADAPGKLVLSGAYAVLEGAPAIVTAVDRRVHADTSRPHEFEAPEVVAGLRLLQGDHRLPWYDASSLRSSSDKLGLGSSAAICVASLGALVAETSDELLSLTDLRERVYPLARRAHREAQGGGSGIDVAAACFGGTLATQLEMNNREAPPSVELLSLPEELVIEVWASKSSASTPGMVKQVFAQKALQPSKFASLMGAQAKASREAVEAMKSGSAEDFTRALTQQDAALLAIGDMAGLEITMVDDGGLHRYLPAHSAFLPSGAGGGDVNLYVGLEPSPHEVRKRAAQVGLTPVSLSLDAVGLQVSPF